MDQDIEGTPLGGELRVVDLSAGIAGGYLGKLLVDAGADVIKVEPPEGDRLRRRQVMGAPVASVEQGGPLFQFLASSKSSAVADPKSPADLEQIIRLIKAADAVIWCSGSPFAGCDAVGPASLRQAAPRAIVTALSPYGLVNEPSGPANEFTLQAMSGGGVSRGRADREPLAAGGAFGDWITGLFGAVGLLTAHMRSRETGVGELVDVAALDGLHLTQNM